MKHATVPYVRGLSEHVKRIFKPHKIDVHFKANSTI